jgi:transposase
MTWLATSAGLGSEGRWVVDRLIGELHELKESIAEVEGRLARLTGDDKVVDELLELAGVGPVTACTLQAEVGRFDRFTTGNQLARYCGLSPRNASSARVRPTRG